MADDSVKGMPGYGKRWKHSRNTGFAHPVRQAVYQALYQDCPVFTAAQDGGADHRTTGGVSKLKRHRRWQSQGRSLVASVRCTGKVKNGAESHSHSEPPCSLK